SSRAERISTRCSRRKYTTGTAISMSATNRGSTLRNLARRFDLNQHIIVKRICGILDNGLDIVNREFRIRLDNLGIRHAMGEQAQDMVDTERGAFYDRFATKNLRIGHDTTHGVNLHGYEMAHIGFQGLM